MDLKNKKPLEIMEIKGNEYVDDTFGNDKKTYKNTKYELECILKSAKHDENLYKCLKANIICSRRIYDSADTNYKKWDIDNFRNILSKNHMHIIFNLNLRWKVSLVECFTYVGNSEEQILATIINTIYHVHDITLPLFHILKDPEGGKILRSKFTRLDKFKTNPHDLFKLLIRIKSIIPTTKYLGLLSLDIIRELYTEKRSIFSFVNTLSKSDLDCINHIIYSNEFDTHLLYKYIIHQRDVKKS